MNTSAVYAAVLAAGLLSAAPVLAQTTPGDSNPNPGKTMSTAQKQKTDGNDPTMVGPASGAYKQHTQGLPPGATPPSYGSAWAKKQQ